MTLGCARNEVDSEELAGRLAAGGWQLSDDPESSDVIVVNTCGFVEQAKKDSVDTLLAAADTGAKVVAVGCMAERYGKELAENLPEADAVLGFDHYPHLAERLWTSPRAGRSNRTRRRIAHPVAHPPVDRQAATDRVTVPGHAGWDLGCAFRLDDSGRSAQDRFRM